MIIRTASPEDIPSLVPLINRAYRGESSRLGWTTEADLLDGLRIDDTSLENILKLPGSLLYAAYKDGIPVATLHAHKNNNVVHFGLFAVEPSIQRKGIGSAILKYAEDESYREWRCQRMCMEVITLREELIAFYNKKGYRCSGLYIPFPSSSLWSEKIENLEMEILEKMYHPC